MKQLKTKACPACLGRGTVPGDDAGKMLKTEREKAGVKGIELAAALNISTTYLYDLENGNRTLTNELLEAYQTKLAELAAVGDK